MGAPTVLLTSLLLLLPAFSWCQLHTLIAPNVFRVESEEKVIVEAHEYKKPLKVDILLHDFPHKKLLYYQTEVTLNKANNFLAEATVRIPANRIEQDLKQKQFVLLTAKSDVATLEKPILVSFQSGYIFIQTDKPLYIPTDKVSYRLFTVDHQLVPSNATVSIDFVNPDDIVVKRDVKHVKENSGIISDTFSIPGIVNLGVWKIVAIYKDAPQKNFSTEFEVKEYVLPSFEVTIDSEQNFFYVDDRELNVEISARYLYGKSVEGSAYVLFGVQLDDKRISITESLKRVPVVKGVGTATLTRDILLRRFSNIFQLVGHSIYVIVTVLTNAGSDMVEAEKKGIHIVTSPYKILFTKTPKYYKPGMPFDLMVYVTNPDGTPAIEIPVAAHPGQFRGITNADGTTKLVVNTPGTRQDLVIMVKTESQQLRSDQQATATMTARPYRTKGNSNNYLHIGVATTEITPGENININFNLKNDPGIEQNIQYFTYVIMSKGKIIKGGRQPRQTGQTLVTMSLTVTTDFIPSFRIISYYTMNTPGGRDVVSDSVWIDVKDTCLGMLQVKPAEDRGKLIQEPGKQIKLKVTGDPGARVGLVAVDKGVFVLNKKNKMTQAKIWDVIEKNDIGCTPGGGLNNIGVFSDAGLAFHSSAQISTESRAASDCPAPVKRKRRSVVLMHAKGDKASKYHDNHQLKKCCEDGMHENPMGHSCEQRAEYIIDGQPCVDAFLDCCNHISKLRKEKETDVLVAARSEEEDEYMSEEDITSRTQFPESWLWDVISLPAVPNDKRHSSVVLENVYLKDSITTWEVQAVSVSPQKGICVAEPYDIIVMKDFFIDLRLPYSAVRNEQIEIKAILYNYSPDEITVRVQLLYNPLICSVATANTKYFKDYKIQGESSASAPYVVIPLTLGEVEIEVKGSVRGKFVSDGIRKKLRVVPEGMKIQKNIKSVVLNPTSAGRDGKQEILVEAIDMKNVVPDTEPETFVSVKGNPVAETIINSIDGANLKHLIQVPSGCGEQNMMSITPAVIATHYLDNTNQWEKIGVDRRTEAIKYITQGYTQQLSYRQPSGAYAAFLKRPPSTWLTAYVAKVFSMAHRVIAIDPQVLCGAVKWLILEKQKPDGIFKEDAPVMASSMTGGFQGAEPEASLTAFVLIAMSEARDICNKLVGSLDGSIRKATDYLSLRYETLRRPYTIAIVSYALSLQNQLKTDTTLMKASTTKTHWKDHDSDQHTIEATAYALLTLTKLQKFELAAPVATWLTEKRFYGGGSGSTQSTIMVFQAIAQHAVDATHTRDFELDVSIALPGRSKPVAIRINQGNAFLGRSERTKLNQDFKVVATGTGQGTLNVMTVYNEIVKEEKKKCKNFDLRVTVEEDDLADKPEGIYSTVYITICTRFLGEIPSTMTILDVTLLTGFSADLNYLKRLNSGVDKYISKYEINKELSDKGSLILYLDKISNKRDECLKIKTDQIFKVGVLQPASVTVYEYYNNDNRCTKFYHPDKESGLLSRICLGDICKCAEENCGLQRKYEKSITVLNRIDEACDPKIDYVYKIKLLSQNNSASYDYYRMEIVDIIKAGSDEAQIGSQKTFITHSNCRESLNFMVGNHYVIMGQKDDLWNLQNKVTYVIGKNSWIEWWPNDVECQDSKHHKKCTDLLEFSENIISFGCQF
ncbi:complement C3-like [Protopterus annectens]|uniref:complement C3-like n=1 Tax=Protopterus annectens TaxID=7888 RepID=UPI001CF9C046|nr:complement C3-like [Protopterus annectens]